MKRKLLALLLAVSFALTVTACGSEETSKEVEAQEDDDDDEDEDEDRKSRSRRKDKEDEEEVEEEELDEEEDEEEPAEEEEFDDKEDEEEVEEDEESEKEKDEESEEEEIEEEMEEKSEAKNAKTDMPTELSDDLYDFQFSIDGTVYQLPMWYSDFEALGWEFQEDETQTLSSNNYTFTQKWEKDGFTVYTQLANLSMNTATLDECIVAEIEFDRFELEECDWEIMLPGDIQWLVSNEEDIKDAYGEPSSVYEGSLYYKMTYEYDTYREIHLYVYKESGVLEKIEIRNMIEMEGADNSVDETVPDLVKNYEAPKKLGDDLYGSNVELEGNLYTLPCPVSVFLENGFEIDESKSDMEIAAGSFGWVNLKYNNQTLRGIVYNYADYATIAENCFVTTVESSEYDPNFDLVIPGGIERGSTEEDVIEVLEDFNFEKEVSDSGFTYYTIFDPNGNQSRKSYELCLKDGVVIIIEVENSEKPEY